MIFVPNFFDNIHEHKPERPTQEVYDLMYKYARNIIEAYEEGVREINPVDAAGLAWLFVDHKIELLEDDK